MWGKFKEGIVVYINFWYPIARSEEITAEKPYSVQLLGMPFVAFRDADGNANVLADTCVHRGGSLSARRTCCFLCGLSWGVADRLA